MELDKTFYPFSESDLQALQALEHMLTQDDTQPDHTIRPPIPPNSDLDVMMEDQSMMFEQFSLWENAQTSRDFGKSTKPNL
jgi:hypothetical protein